MRKKKKKREHKNDEKKKKKKPKIKITKKKKKKKRTLNNNDRLFASGNCDVDPFCKWKLYSKTAMGINEKKKPKIGKTILSASIKSGLSICMIR